MLGLLQVTAGQCLADPGAADALVAMGDGMQILDPESAMLGWIGLTHGAQQRIVASPTMTEPEVIAHQEETHAQPVDQEAPHELIRRHPGEFGTKLQDHDPLDAAVADRAQLLAQPGESRWRGLGCEELQWLWLEGDDSGWESERAAMHLESLKDRTVAQMDPIEIADGRDAAAIGGAQIM